MTRFAKMAGRAPGGGLRVSGGSRAAGAGRAPRPRVAGGGSRSRVAGGSRTASGGRASRSHAPRSSRGLLASFVTLVLACAVAVCASVAALATDPEPVQSASGSTVGILVDNAPSQEDIDNGTFQGNDSNLGIFVTSEAGNDVSVEFYSQGVKVHGVTVAYGALVSEPAPPAWDWLLPDTAGLEEASGVVPAFDAWCVVDGGGGQTAYDFATPVTRPLRLYAGWNFGAEVALTLHGLGGVMDDPSGSGGTVENLALTRYEGSFYRSLPVPVWTGRTFGGWWTSDGRDGGDWGREVAASDRVSAEVRDLYAKWAVNTYWVRYVNNVGSPGGGPTREVEVVYDGADQRFWTWDDAAGAGFFAPSGKKFDGWNEKPDGSGAWREAGAAMPNLTDAAGAYVALFAQWVDDGSAGEGPFDVRFVYNDGATEDRVVSVEKGARVEEPETPKRAGYQFAGWYADEVLTNAWSFDRQVRQHLTLWAKWDLRLDVTVPVSVGFAVDADSGEATGPDEGRYALKSRTVAPVVVEEAALESRQDELEGFFELKDAAGGADGDEGAADEADGTGGGAGDAWAAALADTRLSLGAGGVAVSLPFAGTSSTDEDGAAVWDSEHPLTEAERAAFRMEPFAYGGTPADGEWQGGVPCEELPLRLGLTVPIDQLRVRTAVDGSQKVTRLILTVSAQG